MEEKGPSLVFLELILKQEARWLQTGAKGKQHPIGEISSWPSLIEHSITAGWPMSESRLGLEPWAVVCVIECNAILERLNAMGQRAKARLFLCSSALSIFNSFFVYKIHHRSSFCTIINPLSHNFLPTT